MRSWFVAHRRNMPLLPAHARLRTFLLDGAQAIIDGLNRDYLTIGFFQGDAGSVGLCHVGDSIWPEGKSATSLGSVRQPFAGNSSSQYQGHKVDKLVVPKTLVEDPTNRSHIHQTCRERSFDRGQHDSKKVGFVTGKLLLSASLAAMISSGTMAASPQNASIPSAPTIAPPAVCATGAAYFVFSPDGTRVTGFQVKAPGFLGD
jgi:hypothetical protein